IADTANHRVLRVDGAGAITTVAGTGAPGRGADGVAATESSFNFPSGLAVDAQDDVYVADWQNYLVRKITFRPSPGIAPDGIAPSAAPGAPITILGSNLAGSAATADGDDRPTTLAGTSVMVNGAPIPLSAVSPDRIDARLPPDTAEGTAVVVVISPW